MTILKSKGTTPTEKFLANLCEQSFLKLWSYPNPYKDDRHELCDLLAVFENHVFIFFDRENQIFNNKNNDIKLNWDRWKKEVIDKQTNTAHGVERYIRSGRKIYIDKNSTIPFPIAINQEEIIVHKIIIAHGVKEACKSFSNDNVYGSLGIIYRENTDIESPSPFIIRIDNEKPVHVFDSHNLPVIFNELDTFYDFSSYLDAKIEAIKSYDALVYCGEEDLLAHYLMNFDDSKNQHFIGTSNKANLLMIGEGEWKEFIDHKIYKNKKSADKVSYLWDELIQRTCENTLNGTMLGDSNPLRGQSAIHEMAKEPRFVRRALSEHIIQAIRNFPESSQSMTRYLSFMPSFYENKGYVFLQLKVDETTNYDNSYRSKRAALLEIACGAAKNKFKHLKTVIGIAIDAPKYAETNSEDFVLMDCSDWPIDIKEHYDKLNENFNFFKSNTTDIQIKNITEFPITNKIKNSRKIGRNSSCPCGSGKKYKRCCINI